MTFDDELHRALQRVEPPAGFVDRVLEQLGRPAETPASSRWRMSRSMAFAAAFILTVSAGWFYVDRRQVNEVERAKHDLEVALRITSEKLRLVEVKLSRFQLLKEVDDGR